MVAALSAAEKESLLSDSPAVNADKRQVRFEDSCSESEDALSPSSGHYKGYSRFAVISAVCAWFACGALVFAAVRPRHMTDAVPIQEDDEVDGEPLEDFQQVKTLYHTTSPATADQIMANGFQPGREGWCGGAIYFFGKKRLPKTKLGPDSKTGAVIEAKVDMGRSVRLDNRCRHGADQDTRLSYDSITFNPGDGIEYIVWDPSRVISKRILGRHEHEEEEEQKHLLHSGACCWLGGSCSSCPHGSQFVMVTKCTSSRRCS